MNVFLEKLKQYMIKHPLDLSRGDGDTILEMLYECYDEINGMDDAEIKQDFEVIYRQMNGKSLKEIDAMIYPICKLCRDHQKSGFAEGVRIGYRLAQEMMENDIQEVNHGET